MELRHLRCFIAVAEERSFSRAAERLHIEQSPLSRTIKKLESDLGVVLFQRTSRGTRLTWAGEVFLEDTRRVLVTLEQAKTNAKAAATGYRGTLRVALSDGIARTRLSALLALCREGMGQNPFVCGWIPMVALYTAGKGRQQLVALIRY